ESHTGTRVRRKHALPRTDRRRRSLPRSSSADPRSRNTAGHDRWPAEDLELVVVQRDAASLDIGGVGHPCLLRKVICADRRPEHRVRTLLRITRVCLPRVVSRALFGDREVLYPLGTVPRPCVLTSDI